MKYQSAPPRQRIWEDVKLEIVAEYGRGLSYGQIDLDLERFQQFFQTWQASQSRAIATLKRDFEDTLTFYAVRQRAADR